MLNTQISKDELDTIILHLKQKYWQEIGMESYRYSSIIIIVLIVFSKRLSRQNKIETIMRRFVISQKDAKYFNIQGITLQNIHVIILVIH